MYKPGLHVLLELETSNSTLLTDAESARQFFKKKIKEYGLNALGEVYHTFDNKAFTATVCLTESHLAIHTWPEFNRLTFDIFLSNYQQVNDGIGRNLTKDVMAYFEATSHTIQEVKR